MARALTLGRNAVSIVALGLATSCMADPVREAKIAALGGEVHGVHAGPLHRPGQPCGLCHSAEGPAEDAFSLAGTVYQTAAALDPLDGATVRFIDATGAQFAVRTNCAGNFFVPVEDWAPAWPVWLKIEHDGKKQEMRSAVFRETSCGACHVDPASPSTVGHLYLTEQDVGLPPGGCK